MKFAACLGLYVPHKFTAPHMSDIGGRTKYMPQYSGSKSPNPITQWRPPFIITDSNQLQFQTRMFCGRRLDMTRIIDIVV
jgi:hypothetical protein